MGCRMLKSILRRYRSFRDKRKLRNRPGAKFLGEFRVIGWPPRFGGNGTFEIGNGVAFRNGPSFHAENGGHIVIGDWTFINTGASIYSCRRVEIGPNTLIGDQVSIFDSDFHQVEEGSTAREAPVKIGRNVWIGFRSIILAGVEIGDHSVIGAGSVVTRSIPSRVLAAGNPATVVRELRASDDFRRL